MPINTRSVIKYNDLLEHLGLNNKYSGIVLGESIKFCYLKKNPLNIDVVAYKEGWTGTKLKIIYQIYRQRKDV